MAISAPILIYYALIAVATLIGITFHEAAHAFVAKRLGDETASERGRVTLNPLKHIDPVGTLLLPALLIASHAGFVFGYAKPVPVAWKKLRHPKRDMIWVAAAGPAANIAVALICLAAAFLAGSGPRWLTQALEVGVSTNLILGLFNLLPIPPLDGSKMLAGVLPDKFAVPYLKLGRFPLLPIAVVLLGGSLIAVFTRWLHTH